MISASRKGKNEKDRIRTVVLLPQPYLYYTAV